jgi:predicted MFS family arabinose efflux permease
MTRPQHRTNPWSIVLGSTLALVVCNGPVIAFTFGLFLKPIAQEFGWNRGAISAAGGAASLMIAIAVPFVGMLVDRWGARRILLPVIALSSICVAAISLTPASLLVFVALYAIAGLAAAGHGPQPYVKTIAVWFDGQRGLALGIAMAGVGLGIILVPQLARYLIETCGWRWAYVGLGLVLFAVAFPAVAVLVREPDPAPARTRQLPMDAPAPQGHGVKEALTGSSEFWFLAAPIFLVAMAVNGTIVHVVPLLSDRDVPPAIAASLLGAVGLASIIGRLLCGYLADRLFAPHVAAGFFLLPCLGVCLLMIDAGPLWAFIGVVTLGLALGCEIDMMGFLATRYFGLRRFGELYGYLFAVFSAGSAAGPFLMGLSFDLFRSYNPVLASFIVALVTASMLVSRLGRYVFPVVTVDDMATSSTLRHRCD